jgi:hypothetical protein
VANVRFLFNSAADQCPVFKAVYDIGKAQACTPDAGVLTEREGNGDSMNITRLPGCNPLCESIVWSWGKL